MLKNSDSSFVTSCFFAASGEKMYREWNPSSNYKLFDTIFFKNLLRNDEDESKCTTSNISFKALIYLRIISHCRKGNKIVIKTCAGFIQKVLRFYLKDA